MIQIESMIGLALVILTAGLIFVFANPRKGAPPRLLRPLAAFKHLRRAIGLAVEDGKRLHISLGKANLLSIFNGSTWAGLSAMERIVQLSMVSDRPPVITSGEPVLALLSQDAIKATYRAGNALNQHNPDQARLAGPGGMAYIAGVLPVVRDEQVTAHVFVGHFGPEVGLLIDAADAQNAFTLAASDALPAQAVLYAAAEEVLIGEELFAVSAYLQGGAYPIASLRAQDVLRWLLIGGLIVGALLRLVNVL